ncbi:hypothetical protein C7B82_19485 [Stenomitos frigidus ULC18]|uniref:Uncharacterized protein n=1 Tax=Stenomitos frigidus ULC18 TaxID=2107698 RepID=A0A2T1E1A4_9CYAN|nr:hypothetical protein C7B82_19485 [Stenomitos frigidus ULC18]
MALLEGVMEPISSSMCNRADRATSSVALFRCKDANGEDYVCGCSHHSAAPQFLVQGFPDRARFGMKKDREAQAPATFCWCIYSHSSHFNH